jgi:type II secretory pathway pseudopilin PulG
MRKQIIFRQNGFTLIELALYGGILSALLIVLSNFFITAINVQLSTQATSATEQDSRYILNKFYYDLTSATSITTPPNPGNSSSTLTFVKNGNNYTYATSSGNLTFTDSIGTDNLNSPQVTVTNLNFTRIGFAGKKPTIKINFTLTSTSKPQQGKDTQSFQTTIVLR